nr:DUF934 domain-containing protein [Roseovarius sp.]
MTVIVKDTGFAPEDFTAPITPLAEADGATTALDLGADTNPAELAGRLEDVTMIRVDFPSSADGRGFSIARQLRLMGYD